MAENFSTRLTTLEGRKFGLTVGPVFLVLGVLLFWRGLELGAKITGALGGGLLIASLVAPRVLGPMRYMWMKLAIAISKVTTPILMGVIYFFVISVIGVLRRAFGYNAIKRSASATSYWVPRRLSGDKKRSLEHQY